MKRTIVVNLYVEMEHWMLRLSYVVKWFETQIEK